MSHYIVYESITGKIKRTGNCPFHMIVHQARTHAGEVSIEGKADDDIHKIINGKVVSKTSAEILADKYSMTPIPENEKMKHVNKKDWQDVIDRLEALEAIVNP